MKKLLVSSLEAMGNTAEKISNWLRGGKKTNALRITTPFGSPSSLSIFILEAKDTKKYFVLNTVLNETYIETALDVKGASELCGALQLFLSRPNPN